MSRTSKSSSLWSNLPLVGAICLGSQLSFAQSAAPTFGAGPISHYQWSTGHWVNGESDRDQTFADWRAMPTDSVTQSIPYGSDAWYETAGSASEADVNAEIAQLPLNFAPKFDGIFKNGAWKDHVWGAYPATLHRKKLIHLGWMDPIPKSVGNGNLANPKVWYDIKNGSADKYLFLLGRKFAALDKDSGPTTYPMTFDFAYEWTLTSHPQFPSGSYLLGSERHSTYKDFPYGWSRLVRVFREGYKYQSGKPCPYKFSWRPQLRHSVKDKDGNTVKSELMWPNNVADWNISSDVKLAGVTLLPKGPIGAQAKLLCLSWHDSSTEPVKGSSKTAPKNNWQTILDGDANYWGLQKAADFALSKGVPLCMPEWSPKRDEGARFSPNPGDVIRLSHYFFKKNKSNLAYENVFDQGSGDLFKPWTPRQLPQQDPAEVYRELWK